MDVRVLRNFVCIAELNSLSKAAAKLNVAQPALSRQVKMLEDELGTRLLTRHRRGVALTDAGRLLCDRARAISTAVDEAKRVVSASGSEPAGSVSLGLANSLIYVVSTDIVTRFVERYPRAHLRVRETRGHYVEASLREGQLDVAIMLSPGEIQGALLEPLAVEPLCLAGPPQAALSMDRPVSRERLVELPMIAFSGHSKVRAKTEAAVRNLQAPLQPLVEVEGAPLAFELMRTGLAYTVLPSCAVHAEIKTGRISGAPIEGLSMQWVLGVRRDRSEEPAVVALATLIRDLFAERIKSGIWSRARPGTASGSRRRPARAANGVATAR
jgi:DNA-binding transcriptional LysR family regulator